MRVGPIDAYQQTEAVSAVSDGSQIDDVDQAESTGASTDTVKISDAARALSLNESGEPPPSPKIAALSTAIANGTYKIDPDAIARAVARES